MKMDLIAAPYDNYEVGAGPRAPSYTVPLGLNLMKGLYFTDWTGIMSMSLVSILPMLLIFVFFQRYFVQGIASSGLK